MFITVHLELKDAKKLLTDTLSPKSKLYQTLKSLQLQLQPLHPGIDDTELAAQFFAEVDNESAEKICLRLLQEGGVLAAYTKPPDSLADM